MKRATCALALLFLLAALPLVGGHGAEPKKPSIMQRKLQHAQKVLEGLSLKNFKTISKSADELLFLSKEEEWKVLSTMEYERYSNEFRRNTLSLIKSAKEENLDACACLRLVDLDLCELPQARPRGPHGPVAARRG